MSLLDLKKTSQETAEEYRQIRIEYLALPPGVERDLLREKALEIAQKYASQLRQLKSLKSALLN